MIIMNTEEKNIREKDAVNEGVVTSGSTKKQYLKPVLHKYGEVTKLTMKTGTYADAATLANDFQP